MSQRNSVMRGKRSVLCGALLGVVLLSGGCGIPAILLSTLGGAGLSVATSLLGSLVASAFQTDNTTAG